ncbi:MAG TPA: amino acid permease [Steroidobacteraceae bacterium]|nr:amino acid permease [Steroidobacteraceae bacterium]
MTAVAGETRALGLLTCTALLVGNTIGMGIFMLPASLAPYGLNAVPAWLITTGGCIFIAWVFAGLARAFPQDDGPYAYASRALGGGVAFVLMWCYWVSTWITNAVLVTGVVGYLSIFFPLLGVNHSLAAATALALLWGFVLINVRGVRTAGGVQVLSTVLKLLPQVGIIALGLWALLAPHAGPVVHVPPTPVSVGGLIAASTLALYAMLGVECAAMPAGRVRDPGRTIPRATFIGTVAVALIYMCVSLVPMLLLPQAELAASNAPFADLFARFLGPASGKVLAAFVIVSGLGALNGWTLILGELTVSFAKHGGFPRALGKVNAHSAPTRAFVFTGILASVMMVTNYNESMAGAFTFLSVVVTAANLPIYFGCALAVLLLWRRGQLPAVGLRELRWIAAAFIALVYCVWVSIGIGGKSLLWALALCAAGVPVYGVYWWQAQHGATAGAQA